MSAAKRECHFAISEYFFRLTAEGVRLFSTGRMKHASLDDTIDQRAERASDIAAAYETADLREHLRIIPTEGDIEFKITILETSAASIDEAIPQLEEAIGTSIGFADALSLVFFDLIVERNATEVMTKLGLTSTDASEYRVHLKRKNQNVIPFR